MQADDKIHLEYRGSERGPDCVKNKNPEGYDNSIFFKNGLL